MSDKKDKSKAKGAAAKKGKGKGKAKGKGKQGSAAAAITLAAHPRAVSAISRAKGWGGLGGFALVGFLSWRAGAAPADVALRALAAGVAGLVMAWAVAVHVWRHLAVAELRAARRRAADAARAAEEATA